MARYNVSAWREKAKAIYVTGFSNGAQMSSRLAFERSSVFAATAVHAGDHTVYPDCRPAFIDAIEHEARIANEGFIHDGFRVLAPFLEVHKDEIVRRGVLMTPALAVDGVVKSSGRVLSADEIHGLLT